MQKNYLVLGVSKSGISTTANCLFNRNNQPFRWEFLKEPFKTANEAHSENKLFEIRENRDGEKIIDVKGFDGNTAFAYVYKSLKCELMHKYSIKSVDLIIFVCNNTKLVNDIALFLKIFQESVNIFSNFCKSFLLLIIF
jgi:nicotinamide riboside kinase